MKKLMMICEEAFVAIAFAEAGAYEPETFNRVRLHAADSVNMYAV